MPFATFDRIGDGIVRPGETVFVQLNTSNDFPEFLGLSGQLKYDADEVSFVGVDFLDDLPIQNAGEEPDDASGPTTIFPVVAGALPFPPLPSGAQTVATFEFVAKTAGPVQIEFLGEREPLFIALDGSVIFDDPVSTAFTINTAPVATDDPGNVAAAGALEIDVLANDGDDDGDTLTISGVTDGANGSVAVTAGGVTYTPDPGFAGDDSFTYTISDGIETDTATVGVTVPAEENTISPVADSATMAEDGSIEIDVLDNDVDDQGDTLSIAAFGQGANGTVTETAGGLTYAPDADFNGTDSFTYDVTDGDLTQQVTVDVTVTPVNDDPSAVDDSATVAAGASVEIDVLANDGDVDGDTPTLGALGTPSNGSLAVTAGGVTYTPDAGFSGTDGFTYEVTDGQGGSATGSVTVDVTPVIEPPAGSVTFTSGTPGFVRPGEIVAFALTTSSDFPTFVGFESKVTYDSSLLSFIGVDFSDELPITSAASEPAGASGVITVSPILAGVFNLDPSNDPSGAVTVATYSFQAKEAADTSVLIEGLTGFFFAPDGSILFDDPIETDIRINSLAVAEDDAAEVDEDGSVEIDVLGNDTDADGDTLTLVGASGAANGTLSLAGGLVTYTPDAGFSGGDAFTYEISDGKETVQGNVAVTVTPINDAPVAQDDTATVAEDGTVFIDVLDNDSDTDGDTLDIVAFDQGANGSVALVAGQLVYAGAADFNGSDSFTYTVGDGNGGTDTATVEVTVTAENDAPILGVADSFAFVEGATGPVFTPTASDVDGDALTFSLTGADSGLFVVNPATGEVEFATPPSFVDGGDNVFDVTLAVDDGTLSDSRAIVVTVLKDTDGDGVADFEDNAVFVPNADQRDSNGDGYGNVIDADFNGDLQVGVQDLILLRSAFGQSGLTDSVDPFFDAADADFDGNGIVNTADLQAFITVFGTSLAGQSGLDPIA